MAGSEALSNTCVYPHATNPLGTEAPRYLPPLCLSRVPRGRYLIGWVPRGARCGTSIPIAGAALWVAPHRTTRATPVCPGEGWGLKGLCSARNK